MRTAILALLICLLAVPVFAQPTPIPAPPAGSVDTVAPTLNEAPPMLLLQLKDLQQRYEALKANTDKSARMLLIAGALAAGLKLLLSGINTLAGKKPKKWLAWIALSLAVPIALLSHFAAGHTWFDSFIFAGAGPGAIVVHELMQLFAKKPVEAT